MKSMSDSHITCFGSVPCESGMNLLANIWKIRLLYSWECLHCKYKFLGAQCEIKIKTEILRCTIMIFLVVHKFKSTMYVCPRIVTYKMFLKITESNFHVACPCHATMWKFDSASCNSWALDSYLQPMKLSHNGAR